MKPTQQRNFVSSIPGQMIDNHESISVPLLVISLMGATLAFLLSLSWAAFLSDSVEAVHRSTNNKLPLPVARLLAAIVVTGVAVGLLILLYKWERKVARNDDNDEPET